VFPVGKSQFYVFLVPLFVLTKHITVNPILPQIEKGFVRVGVRKSAQDPNLAAPVAHQVSPVALGFTRQWVSATEPPVRPAPPDLDQMRIPTKFASFRSLAIRPSPVVGDGKAGNCLEQSAHFEWRQKPSSTPRGVTRIFRLSTDGGERHSGVSHRKNPVTEHRRGNRGHAQRIKD